MKYLKYLALLAITPAISYCETTFEVKGKDQSFIDFPHQSEFINHWQLISKASEDDREKLLEWSLKAEESVENQSEAFTIQAYQLEENFKLKDVYQKFIDTLEENILQEGLLQTKVHSEDDKSIYFEWWVEEPNQSPQREWVRLIRNDNNQLVFVRYATSKDQVEPTDQMWTECIERAKLVGPNETLELDENLKELIQLF